MEIKNVNVKLTSDSEKDIMDFLDNKPVKFIFTEAVRMYMKHYKAMQEGVTVSPVTSSPENKIDRFFKQG